MISHPEYPYSFSPEACLTCNGHCCNGESGNIWVSKSECLSISEFLDIPTDAFIHDYLYKKGYRFSLKEIKTGDNYACVFFNQTKNGCGIYPVRPEQCRTFPFWPYFKKHPEEAYRECPGIIQTS